MKIVCDSCGAKYSIADEKVAGKVFKIRCKKCQNIIVVRGNQPEEQAGADTAAATGGGDPGFGAAAGQDDGFGESPVWHVVIDREQVGPMTPSDIRDRYANGDINEETFIWREGFSDWLRLDAVDDFSDISQATKVAPASVAMGMAAGAGAATAEPAWNTPQDGPEADPWAGSPEAPQASADSEATEAWATAPRQELASERAPARQAAAAPAADSAQLAYRDAGQERRRDLFATYAGEESVSDLMGATGGLPGGQIPGNAQVSFSPAGGAASADAGGGDGGFPSDPSASVDDGSNLTGQRNENSVLFSLSNLQELAMGKKASPSSMSGADAPSEGDGSGLIDIRAMAGGRGFGGAGGDELGDLGTYAAPVSAAPVLLPSIDDDRPKWLMPLIIGMAATLVVMIGVVLFLLMRKPDAPLVAANTPPPTAGPAGAARGPTPAAAAAAPKKAAEKKADPAAADDKKDEAAPGGAAAPAAEAKPAKAASKPKPRTASKRKRSSGASAKPASSRSDPILAPAPRKKTQGKSGKRDELDDLIDNAMSSKAKRKKAAARKKASSSKPARAAAAPKPAASSDSNLPETLSRNDIQGGMRGIKGKVQGCYDRYKVPGLASVQITIGRAGRVTSTKVKGVFAGTPTGSCVQNAAKSARFPKFKGTPITITYPFILR